MSDRTKRRKLAKSIASIKEQLLSSASNSFNIVPEVQNSNITSETTRENVQSDIITPTTSMAEDISAFSSESESSYNSSDCETIETSPLSLQEELSNWSTKHNITQIATTKLLKILKPYHSSLPVDCRTLLNTPRSLNVQHCSGGSFIYFGLKENLLARMQSGLTKGSYPIISKIATQHNLLEERLLTITVNVDGLPIYKSSTKSFWPILCVLDQSVNKKPFIVGLFLGDAKPNNSNDFLQEFVNECSVLETNGLDLNNVKYFFRISCFIADAPARSFLKNIVSHNSFHGCEKCLQEGVHIEHRTVWLYKKNQTLRSDDAFRSVLYEDHQRSQTILGRLQVGLVTQVPLDYMHLVCLGVMKRLLRVWIENGPKTCKLNARIIELISERIHTINLDYFPSDFSRRPQSLKIFKFWKATQLRSFLLYLGPIVLIDLLPNFELYEHFLVLHCAIYILASDQLSNLEHWRKYAHSLLHWFVSQLSRLYSSKIQVYNFHNLLHLVDDVNNFGSLDNFAAFPFENFLGKMKKMVRSHNKPLEQVAKRLLKKKTMKIHVIQVLT
uniref:Transposase domain-containing protein n=1 Tax=Cacopsylla melanoneura TaxID=428564 RepID=A0A8D9B7C0_9HEMI